MNRTIARTLAAGSLIVGGLIAAPAAAGAAVQPTAVQSCQALITSATTGKALCLVTGDTQYRVALTCVKIDGGQPVVVYGPWKGHGDGWSKAACPPESEVTGVAAKHRNP